MHRHVRWPEKEEPKKETQKKLEGKSIMKREKQKENVGSFFTPKMIICGIILVIIFLAAIFYKVISTHDPLEVNAGHMYSKAMENGHLLGADKLGRDLFSRLVYGAHSSVINAFLIVIFEIIVGVPIGLICGYYGGWLDNLIMRIWDVVCSLPPLLLSFILIAIFGKGGITGVIAIGISFVPLTAKLARSMIMTEKKAVYIEACKSMGYSDMRIIFIHILPNIITTMISQFTLDVGNAIVSMATLSYLGLGVQPPSADWGSLLEDGMANIYSNMILLLAPALVISITTIAINIFSDGIQEYIDPSSRKLPSFKKYLKKKARMEVAYGQE